MSFDVDEDILQDFLVEAGEILEQLQEQLVELENNPEDGDLLNAIFRGYHTVKGGAGFLALTELVDICHGAENVFDVMRNGQRALTTELMDVILQATDVVVAMFDLVKAREPLQAAPAELIAILHKLSAPERADEAIFAPQVPQPVEAVASTPSNDSIEDISSDDFENLLDELHGKGQFSAPKTDVTSPTDKSQNDISDDEFEALLDEIHGKGEAPQPKADTQIKSITTPNTPAPNTSAPIARAATPAVLEVANAASNKPGAKAIVNPPAKETKKSYVNAQQGETTVRVDTRRLDEIMNMVGELVLVRNRLLSLGVNTQEESMVKAIANLDVVTGDLQGAVMKTRMQPIKKVFGRFPRVVRDLARSLNKEITLVLEGEDTDLDKNLVEALADPLVHLVRNSVDHGVEMPDEREAAGKPRVGVVKLRASQEGDHILLTIDDDGKRNGC